MNRLLLAVFISTAAVSICWGGTEPPASQTSPGASKQETQETTAAKLKKDREEFVSKAQDELGDLNRRIVELRRMARKKTGEARITINQEIRLLESEQKDAEKKLARLKVEIGEKWDALKSDVSDAIEHLQKSVEKTKSDMLNNKKEEGSQ